MRTWLGRSALALAGIALLAGCGSGGGSKAGPATVSVAVLPVQAIVPTGANATFTATVTGSTNMGVSWSIQEGAAGGTITAAGVYTAPGNPGSYHVVATSAADPTKTGTAVANVVASGISIGVEPSSVTLLAGETQTFKPIVVGTVLSGVNFSVVEGAAGGSITAAGVYTAPSTPGTYHVLLVPQADPTKSVEATVTVVTAAISPSVSTLGPGGMQTFTTTILGISNTSVTYTAPDGGSVNASGVFTAPSRTGGYRVIATSVAFPPLQSTAVVTVPQNTGFIVTVTPPAPTVEQGQTEQFLATVTNSPIQGVTWSVIGKGTITSGGLYQAPVAIGTTAIAETVVATSAADPTKQGLTTVTIPPVVINLAVSPPSAITSTNPLTVSLGQGESISLLPTVTGNANTGVTYSVVEGSAGGVVTTTGFYTAPQQPGTFYVILTSTADPKVSVTLTVLVQAGSATVVVE